ncbi:MAG: hypothetical protein ABJA67_10550 [Chthonomonadales bacterium]
MDCTQITPLHWPTDAEIKAAQGAGFRIFRRPDSYFVDKYIKRLVAERPPFDEARWRHNVERIRVANKVLPLIVKQYDWPSNAFIPEDPVDVVLQFRFDDLDFVELTMELEEVFLLPVPPEGPEGFDDMSLGEFMDWLILLGL